MEKEDKNLWQGGLWEQENPQYPVSPPVVVPDPDALKMAKLKTELKTELKKATNLTLGARLGFAGFISLILSLVCLSIVIGTDKGGGFSLEDGIPDVFRFGEDGKKTIIIDPMEDANLPPSIDKAPLNGDMQLQFEPFLAKPLTTQEIYDKCLPTIVFIEASNSRQYATGTGVLMSEDGYIITNAHVIESAKDAQVTLWNNEIYDATLVGYNFEQDLAVLKIDAENLVPAVFANSDFLRVGDLSYAMGNPLGADYRSTFTDGMVSAVDRVLSVDNTSLIFVQTTAAINSGNSGGALINEYGQVVGITTIKIMSDDDTIEGMGFAIPSKRVKQVVDRLFTGEEIVQPTIGISVLQVSEPVSGLEVKSVNRDSNVYAQGMEDGDIIVEANGRLIRTVPDLNLVKGYLFVGDTIEYVVYRNGEELRIMAELETFDD